MQFKIGHGFEITEVDCSMYVHIVVRHQTSRAYGRRELDEQRDQSQVEKANRRNLGVRLWISRLGANAVSVRRATPPGRLLVLA